jgi:hypothetical protein
MNECFICTVKTSTNYTLILDETTVQEDKPVCNGCIADLREKAWIETRKTHPPKAG